MWGQSFKDSPIRHRRSKMSNRPSMFNSTALYKTTTKQAPSPTRMRDEIDSMGSTTDKHVDSVMAPIKLENQQIHSGIMMGDNGAKFLARSKDTEGNTGVDYPTGILANKFSASDAKMSLVDSEVKLQNSPMSSKIALKIV